MSIEHLRRLIDQKLEEVVKKSQPSQARVMAVNGDNVQINPDDESSDAGDGGAREYVKLTGPYDLNIDDVVTVQRGRSPMGKYIAGYHKNNTDGGTYPRQRVDKIRAPGGTMTLSAGTTVLSLATGAGSATIGGTAYDLTDVGNGKVKISSNDTTPQELDGKLIGGFGISLNAEDDGSDEEMDFSQSMNLPNLIINSRMDRWSGGTTSVPDGWVDEGNEVARTAGSTYSNLHGPYVAAFVIEFASTYTFYQDLTAQSLLDLTWAQGKTINFGVYMQTAENSADYRIYIADGVGTTYSSYQSTEDTWEWIKVSRTIDGSATKVEVGLEAKGTGAGGTEENECYIDFAVATFETLDDYDFFTMHPLDRQGVTRYLGESTDNVSNPPTDAQIDTAFGTPAAVGPGAWGIIDDNAGGTTFWHVETNGSEWFYHSLTKAT